MNQFIIVTVGLVSYNPDIEDEKLRELSEVQIGDTKMLININQIESVMEYKGQTAITFISGEKQVTKETFNELLTKISEAQIKSRIN